MVLSGEDRVLFSFNRRYKSSLIESIAQGGHIPKLFQTLITLESSGTDSKAVRIVRIVVGFKL